MHDHDAAASPKISSFDILAVNFTGIVVNWDGSAAILNMGLAIAAVIIELGLILYVRVTSHHHSEAGDRSESQHSLEDHS